MTDAELVNLMCSAPDNFTISSPAQNEPYSRTAHGFALPKMPDLELNGVHIRTVRNEVIALVEQKRATETQRDELLAALELALSEMEADAVKIDGEWGNGRELDELERDGELSPGIVTARAIIARAKGGAA